MTHDYSREDLLRMGRSELRAAAGLLDESKVSDELLIEKVEQFTNEVYQEAGYKPELAPGTPGYNAIKYYGLIQAAYIFSDERGPTSISHARRFNYGNNQQLKFWRDRLIRALSSL